MKIDVVERHDLYLERKMNTPGFSSHRAIGEESADTLKKAADILLFYIEHVDQNRSWETESAYETLDEIGEAPPRR